MVYFCVLQSIIVLLQLLRLVFLYKSIYSFTFSFIHPFSFCIVNDFNSNLDQNANPNYYSIFTIVCIHLQTIQTHKLMTQNLRGYSAKALLL